MWKAKTYDTYNQTDIGWLPTIPSHWEIVDTKRCFLFPKEIVGADFNNYKVLSLSVHGVIFRDIASGAGKYHSDMGTYQIIRPDSIILCLFDMDVTPRIVGHSNKTGIITSAYINIAPKKNINSKYYYYYFLLQDFNKYLFSKGTGIRTTLTRSQFGALKIALPTLEEQTAIANFLDYKTAKIDRFIRKKKQLIKLLNEQKAGIINDAVTGKINCLNQDLQDEKMNRITNGKKSSTSFNQENPDADRKTKPSGIEWLGDIPEHWEVRKLKYVGHIVNGYAFKSDSFRDAGVKVLKITNIQPMRIDWSDISYVEEYLFSELPDFQLKKNDLVFALTRPIIKSGIKAAFIDSDEPILINQRNAVFRLFDENVLLKWIYNTILSSKFIQRFESDIDFTNQQPNISSKSIENIEFALPSLLEQKQIVAHIETETAKLNQTIATIEKEILLVQEYRTALIAEAVTGKIDVRDYQIPSFEVADNYDEIVEALNIAAEDEVEYEKQDAE